MRTHRRPREPLRKRFRKPVGFMYIVFVLDKVIIFRKKKINFINKIELTWSKQKG